MADKPAAEKTEQPTPKKLSKARGEGKTPQSQDMISAVTLMVLLFSITLLGPGLFQWFKSKITSGMSAQAGVFANPQAFIIYMNAQMIEAVTIMLPILAALCVSVVLTSMAIGGVTVAPSAIQFKLDSLNPASALGKLFNTRSAVRLVTSILKLFLVSLIVWFYLRDKVEMLATLRWAWSVQIINAIAKITFGLGVRVGVGILVIGLADALYQKWQYTQDMKMTRQEVKQERKDTDGSPQVKSRIRQIQMEMSMKRLAQEVPKANVILVNPTHFAVALHYEAKTMEAPVLLAKGADDQAQRIIQIARSYGIPIVRRPEATRAIYASVKPGQPIPESLYMAVAEVLAMIFRLRQKRKAPQE